MGGGGVMRAAAKVAGIGALRGERPIVSAARKATQVPASVFLPSSDDYAKGNVLLTAQEGKIDAAAVQRPCWELDDWEFAGGEEEDLFVGSDEPLPRVVFGGAPTPQEAKDATSELKDALEKVYLSSPDSGHNKDSPPLSGSSSSSSSGFSMLYDLENIGKTEIRANPVPRNAIQAFQILSENPAAQSVVASIACDPNVWLAVMDNPELKEFLLTRINNSCSSEIIPLVKESVVCIEFPDDEDDDDPTFLEKKLEELEARVKDFAKNVKTQAVEMVNNLSIYLNNIFGIQMAGKGSDIDHQTGKFSLMEKAMGTSFMGLAVMVIMVVILKRT